MEGGGNKGEKDGTFKFTDEDRSKQVGEEGEMPSFKSVIPLLQTL